MEKELKTLKETSELAAKQLKEITKSTGERFDNATKQISESAEVAAKKLIDAARAAAIALDPNAGEFHAGIVATEAEIAGAKLIDVAGVTATKLKNFAEVTTTNLAKTTASILEEAVTAADDLGKVAAMVSGVKFSTDNVVHEINKEELLGKMDFIPEAALLVTHDHNIYLANRFCHELFGYAPKELFDQKLEVLVPLESVIKHTQQMDEYLKHPFFKPLGQGRDFHGIKKDGGVIPIEIGLYPFGDFVKVIIIDITGRIV